MIKFNNIISSIENLAPLSGATAKIQKLYIEDIENFKIDKLVSLIESDALLSVNILKIANSPIYGFSSKITMVSQAVTLFGMMQVYGFIMKDMINKTIKAKTEVYGLSNERFNDICYLQSALLMQWYGKVDLNMARFLSSLALIMESGKLMIANEVSSSDYESEFLSGFKEAKEITEYEKELLDTTSYGLSSLIFQHWHLDSEYINILKSLDLDEISDKKIQKYVDILKVVIASINMKTILSKNSVLKACKLVKSMGLNPNEFANIALNLKKSYVQELDSRVKT